MRVCVVTAPTGDCPLNRQDPHAAEHTVRTRDAVLKSLEELGHDASVVEAGPAMLLEIETLGPDVILNLATGYRSKKDQANIAAILEMSGIPFTGASSHGHVVGLYKHVAKMAMEAAGIRTPPFQVVLGKEDLRRDLTRGLKLPAIVKPAAEGASLGITEESVVSTAEGAARVAARLIDEFGPPVLIEEFIPGREFTVALLGYPSLRALPVQEIIFKEGDLFSYKVKRLDSVTVKCPAEVPEDLARLLQDAAVRSAAAVGCRDFARVDIRLSDGGVPYVLEVNTLPGLIPDYSEYPRIAAKAGLTYTDIVKTLIQAAAERARSRELPGAPKADGAARGA
ncbi:MAG TPA: ATP-grasp domain-containing protein [Firmicutes bacterium]|nr:ATP-grasp domain-containing protein [Candidatus Fermentithermobacillaceae bacterium]